MNVYVFDENINRSAQYHTDDDLIVAPLSISKVLSSVQRLHDGKAKYKSPENIDNDWYLFARLNDKNYAYLTQLGFALCKEYEYRFGVKHSEEEYIRYLINNQPNLPTAGGEVDVILMLLIPLKDDNVIESYREYYKNGDINKYRWTKRPAPGWLGLSEEEFIEKENLWKGKGTLNVDDTVNFMGNSSFKKQIGLRVVWVDNDKNQAIISYKGGNISILDKRLLNNPVAEVYPSFILVSTNKQQLNRVKRGQNGG